MEIEIETDSLKRRKAKLERDLKAAKKEEKEQRKKNEKSIKEKEKVTREVELLERQLADQERKKYATEARLNITKPLEELEEQREIIKRKIEEDRRIMTDEKSSTELKKKVAAVNFSENTDELAGLELQIQEREALPLRERIKNIFTKYGWTVQAVVLATGLVIVAVSLAALNALKAGTKAVGNGLKVIGKKVAFILPGLIGTIVSFLFKTAGQVVFFLGEHAWLFILAVVAFLIERLLKKRRRQ